MNRVSLWCVLVALHRIACSESSQNCIITRWLPVEPSSGAMNSLLRPLDRSALRLPNHPFRRRWMRPLMVWVSTGEDNQCCGPAGRQGARHRAVALSSIWVMLWVTKMELNTFVEIGFWIVGCNSGIKLGLTVIGWRMCRHVIGFVMCVCVCGVCVWCVCGVCVCGVCGVCVCGVCVCGVVCV